MNDLVDRIVTCANNLGMQTKSLKTRRQGIVPALLCLCLSCSTTYDNNREHLHRGSPMKVNITDCMLEWLKSKQSPVCHLSAVVSLLIWTPSSDKKD